MSLLVINGNNIELLKQYPDNYFDSVVTDPPYGLGKEPDAAELMKDWIEQGYHEIKGTGFMGKEWDAFVPQPLFWKEVFRVLKHGGHIVAFYGTRTYDWGVMAMRFAGFEVRDCIQWLYGSGFPKSHNISKAIDKLNGVQSIKGELKFKGGTQLGVINDDSWKPKDVYEEFANSEDAKNWEGWGSALKPANEPIVLARKPLEKGLSIAENVLKWGTGGINIDGCRIGYKSDDHLMKYEGYSNGQYKSEYEEGTSYKHGNQVQINPQGRFPANIILTHHPECECKGVKKVKSHNPDNNPNGDILYGKGNGETNNIGYAENGEETIEDWSCHPECPIKIMDEQSGILKSGAMDSITKGGQFNVYGKMTERRVVNPPSEGGASRFFYVAKASKRERNKGLEGFEEKLPNTNDFTNLPSSRSNSINTSSGKERVVLPNQNFHPTVKPVKLMQYLVRLVTPPNGKVLDPFCGSGTTGIACKIEGFEFVGMEQDPEYTKIAEARIKNWEEEKEEKTHIIIQNIDTPIMIQQQTLF
jgi:site-specific DNA-methyltransferase (adenine-specific)